MNTMSSRALLIAVMMPIGLGLQTYAASAKDESGSVIIYFKDGHQQSIPASAIANMEFKSAAGATEPISVPFLFTPSKRRFIGKWEVGDGAGSTFIIVLSDDGEAKKNHGSKHGTWIYVDGEARISWDDGWRDVIRKSGSGFMKFAHAPGNSFSDPPSNEAEARSFNPDPI